MVIFPGFGRCLRQILKFIEYCNFPGVRPVSPFPVAFIVTYLFKVYKSSSSYASLVMAHAALMMHYWAKSTDGNGSTMRVMLFDFRKAFDLIDHHVLARKLSSYDIPRPLMCWIIDFLMDRKQRVKFSCDCVSEWEVVPAGVPQLSGNMLMIPLSPSQYPRTKPVACSHALMN